MQVLANNANSSNRASCLAFPPLNFVVIMWFLALNSKFLYAEISTIKCHLKMNGTAIFMNRCWSVVNLITFASGDSSPWHPTLVFLVIVRKETFLNECMTRASICVVLSSDVDHWHGNCIFFLTLVLKHSSFIGVIFGNKVSSGHHQKWDSLKLLMHKYISQNWLRQYSFC